MCDGVDFAKQVHDMYDPLKLLNKLNVIEEITGNNLLEEGWSLEDAHEIWQTFTFINELVIGIIRINQEYTNRETKLQELKVKAS